MASTDDHPLRSLCSLWNQKIEQALKYKKRVFGDDAEEALRFFNGPHDFMFEDSYARTSKAFRWGAEEETPIPYPTFRMTVNKVSELVQIYGPVLYARNPYRMVRPRAHWMPPPQLLMGEPPDPQTMQANPMLAQRFLMMYQGYQSMVQQEDLRLQKDLAVCQLVESYLNYTPNELDLKGEMRQGIDEALIKGRGCYWTEVYKPAWAQIKLIGSFYDSVDNLVIDPDMETVKDAKWIARRKIRPIWEVEQEFGLPTGALKGSFESLNRQAEIEADVYPQGSWGRKHGTTNDLISYWQIYSRMGLGARLSGADSNLRDALDQFGDNCFLVIAKDIPYPLNLPPHRLGQAQAQQMPTEDFVREVHARLEWPIPFWADNDWPLTELDFHDVPRQCWPMSHIKPVMGYQKFLNWTYSFLAAKVKNTSRDFVAVLKSAGEDLKQVILKGDDLALLEIEAQHKEIKEVVQFLQHPEMNKDIFQVVEMVESAFERGTGLSELMYGETPKQLRSAQEAALKGDMLRLRPDDMSEKVESVATRLARKEALAARWVLKQDDVAPVLGPLAAQFWGSLVQSQNLEYVVRELDYRIEAGSTRKPNKDRDVQNTDQGAQVILPILVQIGTATGDIGPVNAFITDWCQARDLDPTHYQLKPPPPPPDPAQQQQQQMQLQQQQHEQQMQQQDQKHQQQMAQRHQEHQHDIQQAQDQHEQAMAQEKEKQKLAKQKAKQQAASSPQG